MRRLLAVLALAAIVLPLAGCFEPSDRRPGTRLSGDVAEWPADWTFTDAEKEIAIEVRGFFGLPHSVTIWCGQLDGTLFVGARDPEKKRWPAWADADPNVRLKIAGKLYEARLTPENDAATLERVRAALGAKYQLPAPDPAAPPPSFRFWRVAPRS
jgi:hypothetical protein